MLSFSRFASRVADSYGGRSGKTLDKGGKLLCMALALDSLGPSLRVFASARRRPELQRSLLELHPDVRYFDVMERVLYNALLSGISFEMNHFFYVNPLSVPEKDERQYWYFTACCPSNMSRFLPSARNCACVERGDSLYVGLYMDGPVRALDGKAFISTDYPWSGDVSMSFTAPCGPWTLLFRVPGWARGEAIPGGLYTYRDSSEAPFST